MTKGLNEFGLRKGRETQSSRGREAINMQIREKYAGRESGFTVVEMALATVTLMVGIMSISAATLRMHQLGRQNREKAQAFNAVHAIAERLNSASAIASVEPGTWAKTMLDSFGSGGVVGNTFDVVGLTAGKDDLQVGTIQIITDETLTDKELGTVMGMPRDLNGDGDMTDTDISLDARMLPIIITAKWRNKGLDAFIKHPLYVMGY